MKDTNYDVGSIEAGWRSAVLRATAGAVKVLPRARHFTFRNVHRCLGAPEHFLATFRGQPFCVQFSDTGISLEIILWEAFEPEVSALVAATLRREPGPFVDVGANKGYFAVIAAIAGIHNHPVVLYEINPVNVLDLHGTRTHGRHKNWIIREVAASSRKGELRLRIPEGAQNSGWARASEDGDHVFPSVSLDDDFRELGLDRISLAKIDVEGHEGEVLKGLQQNLQPDKITNLFIEFHPSVVTRDGIIHAVEDLTAAGYRPYMLTPELRAFIDKDRRKMFAHSFGELRALLKPFQPDAPSYRSPFEVFFFSNPG